MTQSIENKNLDSVFFKTDEVYYFDDVPEKMRYGFTLHFGEKHATFTFILKSNSVESLIVSDSEELIRSLIGGENKDEI